MEKRLNKLKKILKGNSRAVQHLNSVNRVEWLAFQLQIRETVLLDAKEAKFFKKILSGEKYYLHILKEFPESYFVSRDPIPYKWNYSKTKQENLGIFLQYPDAAIEDFKEPGTRSAYCIDYKVFTLSNENSEVWKEIEKVDYTYISAPNMTYKEALKNFYERFNLI